MLSKIRFLAVLLAFPLLPPVAFSAPTTLGSIVLNESTFEKFGALYFPFRFEINAPLLFVLCENGVAANGGCLGSLISDVVCITNNTAGEGVAAMISDHEAPLSLGNLPPDFPCQTSPLTRFVTETGRPQVLSGSGIPTILPSGALGPIIRVTATSDLEQPINVTSDILTISTQ